MKGFFYQPLNRDAAINEQQWQSLLHQAVTSEGLSEVVVQWNQYGEANFGGKSGWLADRLLTFDKAGLKLWFGLYADPRYFEKVHSDDTSQRQYLVNYFELLLANYNNWRGWLNEHKRFVKGVYIPAELSDYDFDTPQKRALIKQQLHKVQEVIKEPMMISVYLSGNSSPESIKNWLSDFSDIGIKVVVQDGRGTQLLTDKTWWKYRIKFPCHVGLIKEIFAMTQNYPPIFQRVHEEVYGARFAEYRGCHDSYAFSLRYLPISNNPLKLRD